MFEPRHRRGTALAFAVVTTTMAVAFLGVPAQAANTAPSTPTVDSVDVVRLSATAVMAPESAFENTGSADTSASCVRPAPTNSVSTTIHCHRPDEVRAWYGLGPLAGSNDGAGQTIVLVDSYGSPTAAADLAFFASTFGGPTPDLEQVYPLGQPGFTTGVGNSTGNGAGQSGPSAAAGWAGEANLDVQWAYAIAPRAHLVLLAVPPAETQGVQGLPNLMKAIDWAIAKYPAGTVFSMSFGTSESAFGGNSAAVQFARFDQTFQRGLAKGDTFFSSSGDDGSTGVERSHRGSTVSPLPQAAYPTVSPYVTSVGGTQLQDSWVWKPISDAPFTVTGARNPNYWAWQPGVGGEPVWNESFAGIGTGGGLSNVYPRPAFQDSVAAVVGSRRGMPDLSWNAAVNGGVLVWNSYYPGDSVSGGTPRWGIFGGTSASSPQVAALTAIGNAARAAAGKGPIGDLNKALYSASFNKAAAFRDVAPQSFGTTPSGVLASNRMWDLPALGADVVPSPVAGYPTTAGYDLTTGWGSPRAAGFVAQLVAQP